MPRKKTNRALKDDFSLAGIKGETLIPLVGIMGLVFIFLSAINVSLEASFVISFFIYLGWLLLNAGGRNNRYIAMLIRAGTPAYRLQKTEGYKPLLTDEDSGGENHDLDF